MDNEINDRSINPLIRIADALEEILRLVKKDQEQMQRYKEETTEKWDSEADKSEVYIETLNGPELRDDGKNYK